MVNSIIFNGYQADFRKTLVVLFHLSDADKEVLTVILCFQ